MGTHIPQTANNQFLACFAYGMGERVEKVHIHFKR